MIRKAAVAGYFYPAEKAGIESMFRSFDFERVEKAPALGVVVPHAGYRFSGLVAASVYSRVELADTVILLGPNHGAGRGSTAPPAAIMSEGLWELPTGKADVNGELAELLLESAPMLTDAGWAHADEHCLEVQLPFIHYYSGDVSIAPIILKQMPVDDVMELADGIATALREWGRPVTLVASTDFSHYVPHALADKLDHKAIEKIEALDAKGLIELVDREKISMCGAQPTAVVMEVCKRLGASGGKLVKYQTSGDSTGDFSSVVGYGGLVIR